jgi:hypothetical protein
MRRLIGLALLLSGCNRELPPIPESQRAICAGGGECRSIKIGQTLIRGNRGEPLFSELVTDDPAAYESIDTLSTALKQADARLSPDYTITPRLCVTEPTDKVIQASHKTRIPMETYYGLCTDEVIGAYGVIVKADGTIACIENAFGLICP